MQLTNDVNSSDYASVRKDEIFAIEMAEEQKYDKALEILSGILVKFHNYASAYNNR